MAAAQVDQIQSHHAPPQFKLKAFRASAKAQECFDNFLLANTMHTILLYFNQLCDHLDLNPAEDPRHFYQKFRSRLFNYWSAQNPFNLLDKRVSHKEYKKQNAAPHIKAMVIGAGPCGLRCAIEMALLGAKVVVVEKRDRFSRNNVLHLWPFLIHDLAGLGAKKFFGKFCAGSIDHISIRTLQCILLKVALIFGVQVYPGVSFEELLEPEHMPEPTEKCRNSEPDNPFNINPDKIRGWRARLSPANHILSQFEIDVLIGADGKRNTLQGFRRKEFRGKLAIAITANFVRSHNWQEAQVEEISGVSFIFNQQFFETLSMENGIELENIVYYKDETHYFVMTAKKNSLINKGVIKQDYEDPAQLLHSRNIDNDSLLNYAREAAQASTNYQLPKDIPFALNHYGQPDVAVFDFTSLFASENASRVLENKGKMLVTALVGDSLHEPFWPTGSGCARGFLGALDAAWMVRRFAQGFHILDVIAERESIYQRLSQTTPQNMFKDYQSYTIDPRTRYPALDLQYFKAEQVKHLFSTDDPLNNPALRVLSPPGSHITNKFSRRLSHGHTTCEPTCDCLSPTCHHHHHHHHHHHPHHHRSSASRPYNQTSSHHHSGQAPLSPVSPGIKSCEPSQDQLLKWLQIRLSRYQDLITIQDLRRETLSDGVALLCLIHAYKPSLVELSTVQTDNSVKNNKLAFFLLEDEFGIESLLSSEEMICPLPNTDTKFSDYLEKIYLTLRDLNPERENEATNRSMDVKTTPSSSSAISLAGLGPRLANEISASRHFHHPTFLPNKSTNQPLSLGTQVASVAMSGSQSSGSLLNRTNNKRQAFNNGAREAAWFVERGNINKKRDILLNAWDGKSHNNDRYKKPRVSKLNSDIIESMHSQVSSSHFDKEKAAAEGFAYVPKKAQPISVPENVAELLGHKKSELCHFCNRRVYIAERASAEGVFFHRNCLRCGYCNAHLLITSYKSKRSDYGRVEFYCYAHADTKPDDGRKTTAQLRASIIKRVKAEKDHHQSEPQFRPTNHNVDRIKTAFQAKPLMTDELERHFPSSRGDASDAWLYSRLSRGLGDVADLEAPCMEDSKTPVRRHRQRKKKKKLRKALNDDDDVDCAIKCDDAMVPLTVLCPDEDFSMPSSVSNKARKSYERISVELGAINDKMPLNEAAARPKSPEQMDEESIMAHNLLSSRGNEFTSDSEDVFDDLNFSLDEDAAECFASTEENPKDDLIFDDEAPRSRHYYLRVLAQCQIIKRSRMRYSSSSSVMSSCSDTSSCGNVSYNNCDPDHRSMNRADFFSRQDVDNPSASDFECQSFPPKSHSHYLPLSELSHRSNTAVEGVVNRESIEGGKPGDVEDVLLNSLDRSLSKTSQTSDQSRPVDLSVDQLDTINNTTGDNPVQPAPPPAASVASPKAAIYQMAKMKFCMEAPKPVSIDPKEFIGQMNQKKVREYFIDDCSEVVEEMSDKEPCTAEFVTTASSRNCLNRQTAAQYLTFSYNDTTSVPCKAYCLEVKPIVLSPCEISLATDETFEQEDTTSDMKSNSISIDNDEDANKNHREDIAKTATLDPARALSYNLFDDIKDIDSISVNTENSSVSQTEDSDASATDPAEVVPSSHTQVDSATDPTEVVPSSHTQVDSVTDPTEVVPSSHTQVDSVTDPTEVVPSSHTQVDSVTDPTEVVPSSHTQVDSATDPTEVVPSSHTQVESESSHFYENSLPIVVLQTSDTVEQSEQDKVNNSQPSSSVASRTPSRSSSSSSRCSSVTTDQPPIFSPLTPQKTPHENSTKKATSPGLNISSSEDTTVRKSASLNALDRVNNLYRAVAELCPEREPVTTGDSASDDDEEEDGNQPAPRITNSDHRIKDVSSSSSSSTGSNDENNEMPFGSLTTVSAPTWHNRQAQMSRIRQGQDLQRHLREVQEQLKDLELAGVRMEKQLRKMDEGNDEESSHNDFYQNCYGSSCESTTPPVSDSEKPDPSSYSFLYDQLVELMAEKERLMVTEQELALQLKQFELDEKLEKVQEEYQSRLTVEENYKSDRQKASDARLLAEYTTLLAERESLSSLKNNPSETSNCNNDSASQSSSAPVTNQELD